MTPQASLTRRTLLATGTMVLATPAIAQTAERQAIVIGDQTFNVPKPYLFNEVEFPGMSSEGLPAFFSFAFTMPDGEPAGTDIEFPPISRPFVLEREKGRYLVMCYRVASPTGEAGRAPLRLPTMRELQNILLTTSIHDYSEKDGQLEIVYKNNADMTYRYVSDYDRESKITVRSLLLKVGNGQFYSGNTSLDYADKPFASCVMFIPVDRAAAALDCGYKAGQLLSMWKER